MAKLTNKQIEVLERKSWDICGAMRSKLELQIIEKVAKIRELKREGELNGKGKYNTEVSKHLRTLSKKELVIYISNRLAQSDVFRLYDVPRYEEFCKTWDAMKIENPCNLSDKQQKSMAKLEEEVEELKKKQSELSRLHQNFMDEVILEGQGELMDKLKDFENIIAIGEDIL